MTREIFKTCVGDDLTVSMAAVICDVSLGVGFRISVGCGLSAVYLTVNVGLIDSDWGFDSVIEGSNRNML
jgi:hypothetical protein